MTPLLAWGLLALAICLEVAATSMLKLADGFQRPFWFAGSLATYGACFALLTHAFRWIPLSIAYAIWSGLGAALIVALDMLVFGQTFSPLRLGFIALIIVGVVGLKLTP